MPWRPRPARPRARARRPRRAGCRRRGASPRPRPRRRARRARSRPAGWRRPPGPWAASARARRIIAVSLVGVALPCPALVLETDGRAPGDVQAGLLTGHVASATAVGTADPVVPLSRAAYHPDFHRRSGSSTQVNRPLAAVGSRTVTAGSELHRPRSTSTPVCRSARRRARRPVRVMVLTAPVDKPREPIRTDVRLGHVEHDGEQPAGRGPTGPLDPHRRRGWAAQPSSCRPRRPRERAHRGRPLG